MIGNDVVDLRETETFEGAQHPGFDDRVFRPVERDAISRAAEPRRTRWMLWAAKEAAYKALRREHPRFVFSPRALEVEVDDSGRGRVRCEAGALALRIEFDGDCISALAIRPGVPAASVSVHVITPIREFADRNALRRALGERLRLEAARRGHAETPATLERNARIPALRVGLRRFPVSIAHHGRVASAAVCWRGQEPPRTAGGAELHGG